MHNWLSGFNFQQGPGRYQNTFKCYSAVFLRNATAERIAEIDYGGKIILPPSALQQCINYNVPTPMLFKVSNPKTGQQRATNCGVIEFSMDEGMAILPHWMMQQLSLKVGEVVSIESTNLPKATFAKLKPMSLEFLNITNPRAVLEVEMRKYACLTKGDKISTSYAGQTLDFLVTDLKPANAVCIIECDVNLDFDAPEGYVEQPRAAATANVKPSAPPAAAFAGAAATAAPSAAGSAGGVSLFSGTARRLDGKKKGSSVSVASEGRASTSEVAADVPAVPPVVINDEYKPGSISFVRYDYKRLDVLEKELKEKSVADKAKPSQLFTGGSRTLRGKN